MKPNKRKQMLDPLKNLCQVLEFALPLGYFLYSASFVFFSQTFMDYYYYSFPVCLEDECSFKQTL